MEGRDEESVTPVVCEISRPLHATHQELGSSTYDYECMCRCMAALYGALLQVTAHTQVFVHVWRIYVWMAAYATDRHSLTHTHNLQSIDSI